MKTKYQFLIQFKDLDLTPYLSGPLQQGGELFSLYGAVCHSGGLGEHHLDNRQFLKLFLLADGNNTGAGHYTAFARHNDIGQWNYFNDAHVRFPRRLPLDYHVNLLCRWTMVDCPRERAKTMCMCSSTKGLAMASPPPPAKMSL